MGQEASTIARKVHTRDAAIAPSGTAPSRAAGVQGASDSGPGVYGLAGYNFAVPGGCGGQFEILSTGLA